MTRTVKKRLRDFLVWSQGFTGTDNVYIAKGGFWTTVQFGVSTVASIATVIAFANLLPREIYGTYKYLLSLASSLGFLTLTGMNTAVLRALARDQVGVLQYAVRLQLRYNLLAVAATGGLALYYAIQGNITFALSLGILAVCLPLTSVYSTYTAALTGLKRFDQLAVTTAISAFIAAAAVIAGLYLTDNIVTLIGTYGLATLVPSVLIYQYVKRRLPQGVPAPEAVAELRRTGFHLTAVGVLATAAQYLDKIVLFQAAGPAALAVYAFAIAGPERLKGFAKGVMVIALPRLVGRDIRDIRQVFYVRIAQSMAFGILLAAAYALLAPTLFRWLLPGYLDAVLYSQIYALNLIFLPAAVYAGSIFQGQNMLRATYITGLGGHITRILLFVVLGWRWGVWGLIVAVIVNTLIVLMMSIVTWEIESRKLIKTEALRRA